MGKRRTFRTGVRFVRDLFGARTPRIPAGLNEAEWHRVRVAGREELFAILAGKGVRAYNGYPLVTLDDDELRDVYALVTLQAWRKERDNVMRQELGRYVERLKRTQVLP